MNYNNKSIKNKAVLLTLIVFCSCSTINKTITRNSDFNNIQYVRTIDGDTVVFNIPDTYPIFGEEISIRIYGINAPEIKGSKRDKCEVEKAKQAKELVEKKLSEAKKIELRNSKRGKFFRIVADVIYDGNSVADLLLEKKLAYPYYGDKREKFNWCSN